MPPPDRVAYHYERGYNLRGGIHSFLATATLIDSTASDGNRGSSGAGDISRTVPELGPRQGNGGPTFTHVLLLGSPAIDAGDDGAAPATDQRGTSRPQGAASDFGAFELVAGVAVPSQWWWGLVAMAALLVAAYVWRARRSSHRQPA